MTRNGNKYAIKVLDEQGVLLLRWNDFESADAAFAYAAPFVTEGKVVKPIIRNSTPPRRIAGRK